MQYNTNSKHDEEPIHATGKHKPIITEVTATALLKELAARGKHRRLGNTPYGFSGAASAPSVGQ